MCLLHKWLHHNGPNNITHPTHPPTAKSPPTIVAQFVLRICLKCSRGWHANSVLLETKFTVSFCREVKPNKNLLRSTSCMYLSFLYFLHSMSKSNAKELHVWEKRADAKGVAFGPLCLFLWSRPAQWVKPPCYSRLSLSGSLNRELQF